MNIISLSALMVVMSCISTTVITPLSAAKIRHIRGKNGKYIDNPEYLLKKQQRQLESVGCRPRIAVIKVRDLLDKNDPMQNDKDLHPEVIVAKRCIPQSSYCGDKEGHLKQSCEPTNTRMKKVMLATSKQHKLIEVQEHSQCGCQSRTW